MTKKKASKQKKVVKKKVANQKKVVKKGSKLKKRIQKGSHDSHGKGSKLKNVSKKVAMIVLARGRIR